MFRTRLDAAAAAVMQKNLAPSLLQAQNPNHTYREAYQGL